MFLKYGYVLSWSNHIGAQQQTWWTKDASDRTILLPPFSGGAKNVRTNSLQSDLLKIKRIFIFCNTSSTLKRMSITEVITQFCKLGGKCVLFLTNPVWCTAAISRGRVWCNLFYVTYNVSDWHGNPSVNCTFVLLPLFRIMALHDFWSSHRKKKPVMLAVLFFMNLQ